MLRAGYWVSLTLAFSLLLAGGCGAEDKAKRVMDSSDGGVGAGGETGDAGSAGSAPTGTSGSGGEVPDPGGGGSGGEAPEPGGGSGGASGGAPSAAGGADVSAAGAGGSDSSTAFISACAYPGGGDCDELTGTSDEASEFERQCLFNERIPLDACPRTNVAGTCTSSNAGPIVRNFLYAPLDPDELNDAEERCLALPGEWMAP